MYKFIIITGFFVSWMIFTVLYYIVAIYRGDFSLIMGEKIDILVGQMGGWGGYAGSGGGGTFVVKTDRKYVSQICQSAVSQPVGCSVLSSSLD